MTAAPGRQQVIITAMPTADDLGGRTVRLVDDAAILVVAGTIEQLSEGSGG